MQKISQQRIGSIDALRGLCLFGLLMVHCCEYYELYWASAQPASIMHDVVFFLFGGKAYAIFALLFGVSFCIITDQHSRTRPASLWRFSWRLLLLLVLGYLHGLLYLGDILVVLAVAGIPMLLLSRLPTVWVGLCIVVLIGQGQLLTELLFTQWGLYQGPNEPLHWQAMPAAYQNIIQAANLRGVMSVNVLQGQYAKWLFMLESGRFCNIIGMALLGIMIWRHGYIGGRRQRHWWWILFVASGLWAVTGPIDPQSIWAGHSPWQKWLANQWLDALRDNLFTFAGVALFMLIYAAVRWRAKAWLANTGRMGLSVYVSQSLLCVWVFYPFGLGLYSAIGQNYAVLFGVVVFALQVWACHLWLRHFRYGPLEWLWRRLTWLRPVPFRIYHQAD